MNLQQMQTLLAIMASLPDENAMWQLASFTPGALSVEFLQFTERCLQTAGPALDPDVRGRIALFCVNLLAWLDSQGGALYVPPAQSQAQPGSYADLFQQYQSFVTRAAASGEIDPARVPAMDRSTDRLQALMRGIDAANDPSTGDLRQLQQQKRELASLMTDALSRTQKRAGTATRTALVRTCLDNLKLFAMRGQNIPLAIRLGHLTKAFDDAGGDQRQLLMLETEEARNAANDVRTWAKRANLSLLQPIWPFRNTASDPNFLFYAGPDSTRELLENIAATLQLEIGSEQQVGADLAESRWTGLEAATLAVFDLSEKSPQTYYELGIAAALGKELLLLTSKETELPFDTWQSVFRYSNLEFLRESLATELTSALYGRQSTGEWQNSLSQCLGYVERLAERVQPAPHFSLALQRLRDAVTDPERFADALPTLNTCLGSHAQLIAFPPWPALYPTDSRCFVVMPFSDQLEPVIESLLAFCTEIGVECIRGDSADAQNIVQSIWWEIGAASRVIVDLTDFNLNVCFELGMADTLGRPTFLIGLEGTEKRLQKMLPSAAKRRLHRYTMKNPAGNRKFRKSLDHFLRI